MKKKCFSMLLYFVLMILLSFVTTDVNLNGETFYPEADTYLTSFFELYIYTDRSEYTQEDLITLFLTLNNYGDELNVDIYLAIMNPSKQILFSPFWGVNPSPILSGISLPGNFNMGNTEIYTLEVGKEGSPVIEKGSYTIIFGITASGTFDFFEGNGLVWSEFMVVPALECPPDMVRIPLKGSESSLTVGDRWGDGEEDESGNYIIPLRAYCIDKYEYPNKPGEYPYNYIDWYDASGKCISEGKRLCTEFEWEKACKGIDDSKYSYGSEYNRDSCNVGPYSKPETSGARSECVSSYGIFDMDGNFREWTADWYKSYPGGTQSFNFTGYYRTIRGGDFLGGSEDSRCSNRGSSYPNRIFYSLSFRCCKQ